MKGPLLFLVSLLIHQTALMALTQPHSTTNRGNLNNRSAENIRNQILALRTALHNERNDEVISRCNAILRPRLNNKLAAYIYWKRSTANYDTNRIHEAMSDAESAIHVDPTSSYGYLARAYINDSSGNHKLALADLNEAIRRDPRNFCAYSNRGTAYYFLGDYDRALADYTEAIRRNPNDSLDARNRALVYLRKHNYKAAFADLEASVLRPQAQTTTDYRVALNTLAWNLATCPDAAYHNGRRAVELSKRACDLSHWKRPGSIDTLAAAYAECGDFDRAIKYQTQAVSMVDPPKPGLTEKEKTSAMQERREHLILYKNHNACRDEHQRRD